MLNSILITGGTEKERLQKSLEIRANLQTTSGRRRGMRAGGAQGGGFPPTLSYSNDPDFMLLESSNSIGIDQIRQLQKKLSRKPFQSKLKIAFIHHAESLTIPAQNALLKTLEEPPAHTIIILSSPHAEALLPTIISRCQIINLPPKPQISPNKELLTTHYSLLTDILKSRLGKRLLLIQPFTKNRDEALTFCQNSIVALHNFLSSPVILKSDFSRTEGPPAKSTQAGDSSSTASESDTGTQNDGNLNLSRTQIATLLRSLQKSLDLLHKNVNVKLVMENMVLFW